MESGLQDAILVGHEELRHHAAVGYDAGHPVHGRGPAVSACRGVGEQQLRGLLEVRQEPIDQSGAVEETRGDGG